MAADARWASALREERVLAANSAISEAISDADEELALALIDELGSHRVDVVCRHVFGSTGCTLLHFAVSQRLPRVVRKLVEAGATVDVDCSDGTAAYMAAVQGEVEILTYLVEHGANVSYRRADGPQTTLLMGAIANDRTEVALALLDWGADWADSIRSTTGYNTIEWALGRLNVDVFMRLAKLGAGSTFGGPLKFAVTRGAPHLVKACLGDPDFSGPFLRGEQPDLIGFAKSPPVLEMLLAAHSESEIAQSLVSPEGNVSSRALRSAPML